MRGSGGRRPSDGVDAVVPQGRRLAGADAVQGVHWELGEPIRGLVGGDGEDASGPGGPGGGGDGDGRAGTERTSTPRREIVRIRSTSPSRCGVVP
jgi:hypothetical protein